MWWHCGYPASDATCARGWESLNREVGVDPQELLDASPANLAGALRGSGMFPELRAARLKEIAARVQDEFGGDLRTALVGSTLRVRKTLKSFPGIGDPGADRILLFGGLAPTAAVPSNCTQVVVRLLSRHEPENYVVSYREAGNRGGSSGEVRRPRRSLPAAEAPWPGDLQASQSQLWRVPRQLLVRLFCGNPPQETRFTLMTALIRPSS